MFPTTTINRASGGIGRQATGVDYYSGYCHYFPTGWSLPAGVTTGQINLCRSIADVVALGFKGDSADETASTATWLCTNAGVALETVEITVKNPLTLVTTSLGVATVPVTPTTTTTATALKNAINALTYIHGYTATSSTATVTIKAAPGLGILLNTGTPYTVNYSATPTVAGTLTQNVVTGIGSQWDVLYYHMREAFRIQGIYSGLPQGQIWLGIYNIVASPSTYANFTEVKTMQSVAGANGMIRQIGVYATSSAFATSHVDALQSRATELESANTPLSIIYQGDFSGIANLNTLLNLRTLSDKNVSVTIGQDGANVGNQLYQVMGKSVGCVGTVLGAVALAKVSESIMWRQKFNVIDVLEYKVLAFANGQLQSALGAGLLALMTGLDAYGYIFLVQDTDIAGTFFNQDNCCVASTSPYAFIADNRTIDKEARVVRAAIMPSLGGPINYNPNGTMTADWVARLEGIADNALADMLANGEISAEKAIIDPTQNVQSTKTLTIGVQNVQTGVIRNIVINIGFVASITK